LPFGHYPLSTQSDDDQPIGHLSQLGVTSTFKVEQAAADNELSR